MPLLILFILIPLIEIALFILVGGWIGLWPTIGLVILSAVLGIAVIRGRGRRSMMELQESYRTFADPTKPLAHGAITMFAGMLLILPGFFTDTIGLLLLIPGVRNGLLRLAGRRVTVNRGNFGFDGGNQPRHGWPGYADEVIEGDYVVQEDPYTSRDDIELPGPKPRDSRAHRPSGWTREE
ncbi:MAG: FxsA family protein [Paracoccus sp. (in: a-proteobacteria)]